MKAPLLYWAVQNNHKNLVKAILSKNPDINIFKSKFPFIFDDIAPNTESNAENTNSEAKGSNEESETVSEDTSSEENTDNSDNAE